VRARSVGRLGARGFTLIELVVALAIAALAVALVPPALEKLRDGMHYRDTVRAVVTGLRAARERALTQGAEARYVVDLAGRRFGPDTGPLQPLPAPLQLRLTVAGIEWRADQVGAIRFLPQGGATGGSVDVLRADGSGVRVTVDWLSAAVSQTAIER
jgi:general secretion pathway protein H